MMRTRTWTQRVSPTPFEMSKCIDTETRVLGKNWASDSTKKTDLGTYSSSQPQRKVMLKAGREIFNVAPLERGTNQVLGDHPSSPVCLWVTDLCQINGERIGAKDRQCV